MGSGPTDQPHHSQAQLLTALSGVITNATTRANDLRARVTHESAEVRDPNWIAQLVADLDIAHEELRAAEEALYTQAKALFSMEGALFLERQRYRDLFDHAPDPYFVTDLDGVVLEANRRAGELLRIQPRYLAGKPLAVFVGEGDRPLLFAVLTLLASSEEVATCALHMRRRGDFELFAAEASVTRATGPEMVVALRWIVREQGGVDSDDRAIAPIERDSRVLELERALALERRRSEVAEHQVARRDKLFAFVVHELRNPLTTISGWLSLLVSEGNETGRRRGADVLVRSVRMLMRLVEELALHAQVVSDVVTLELEDIELAGLVARVSDAVQVSAAARSLKLVCDFGRADGLLHADAFRLHQLLVNLLGNAIKFTPAGGLVEFSVNAARRDDDRVEFSVRDTGCGLAPEHLRTIFEPFMRVGQRDASLGLGLGLSIAHKLTELHGGTLVAESEGLGTGATFRLTLPRSRRA